METADYCGALYADENNNLGFSENSNFEGKHSGFYVGALYDVENNTLSFSGNSSFKGIKHHWRLIKLFQ